MSGFLEDADKRAEALRQDMIKKKNEAEAKRKEQEQKQKENNDNNTLL